MLGQLQGMPRSWGQSGRDWGAGQEREASLGEGAWQGVDCTRHTQQQNHRLGCQEGQPSKPPHAANRPCSPELLHTAPPPRPPPAVSQSGRCPPQHWQCPTVTQTCWAVCCRQQPLQRTLLLPTRPQLTPHWPPLWQPPLLVLLTDCGCCQWLRRLPLLPPCWQAVGVSCLRVQQQLLLPARTRCPCPRPA